MSNRCMLILNNKDYLVPPLHKENGELYTVQEKVIEAYYLGREREFENYFLAQEPFIDKEKEYDGLSCITQDAILTRESYNFRNHLEKEKVAEMEKCDYNLLSVVGKLVYDARKYYARIRDKVNREIKIDKDKQEIPEYYYTVSDVKALIRAITTISSKMGIECHFIAATLDEYNPRLAYYGLFIPNITEEQEKEIYDAVNAEFQSLVIKPTIA